MKEQELNVNELIKVESLPKIMYQLEIIGNEIDKRLVGVEEMQCDESNKQEVKKRKQDITRFKKEMEDRRKEIKTRILEPYNIFNEKYENEVKIKLEDAEDILRNKYETIENMQKLNKENEIRKFANEYIISNNLQDILTFERIGLNITLSASEKSLKEQAKMFIENIAKDVKFINKYEDSNEIMLEYIKDYNLTRAIEEIQNRKEMLKRLEEQKKQQKEKEDQEQEIIKNVDNAIEEEIIAPKEIIEEEKQLEITFTIKGTKEQIISVREFLINNGIEYR